MSPRGWAEPIAQVRIDFDDASSGVRLAHDVSAIARLGDTLFLACDETATIEVMHRTGERSFGEHETVHLDELFALPDPGTELDIEGLAIEDSRLWIVGSHSCTRRKPKKDAPVDARALDRLADIKPNANRHFLGCLPLLPLGERRWTVGNRGAMLPVKGNRNALSKALMRDPHIAPFIAVPAKEMVSTLKASQSTGRRSRSACAARSSMNGAASSPSRSIQSAGRSITASRLAM